MKIEPPQCAVVKEMQWRVGNLDIQKDKTKILGEYHLTDVHDSPDLRCDGLMAKKEPGGVMEFALGGPEVVFSKALFLSGQWLVAAAM
jgi:hypothetical protein